MAAYTISNPLLAGRYKAGEQRTDSVAGQPQSGIWFGISDDLWKWAKPQGWGGPWRKTTMDAGALSDPFLMTGFDKKVLHLKADAQVHVDIEVDFLGNGDWNNYAGVDLPSNGYQYHVFPDGFSAHWVRLRASAACSLSAEFIYT